MRNDIGKLLSGRGIYDSKLLPPYVPCLLLEDNIRAVGWFCKRVHHLVSRQTHNRQSTSVEHHSRKGKSSSSRPSGRGARCSWCAAVSKAQAFTSSVSRLRNLCSQQSSLSSASSSSAERNSSAANKPSDTQRVLSDLCILAGHPGPRAK